ncbi:hypothetical protein L2Y96_07295 [Luteibacter aegosomaticola]|uniref:hypothetical protein n=1 Tax=Luteibacter aegosomaticola TaxID=2911538 RepID=UPI001FFC232E|nr:hypothetical protein [Luteibacter aegosomaticola]UPG91567.1 hypothetical protein L2Y96_07295 [Luteibacter aegosomaticola]
MKTLHERLKPFYMAPVAFLIAAGLLTTCQQSGPTIRRNPDPRKPISVEAAITGAPGPIDTMRATAHYQIENVMCVPVTGIEGVRKYQDYDVGLQVIRTGDRFQTTAMEDALLDGDFYRQGVCHWELSIVTFIAQHGSRKYSASISPVGKYAKQTTRSYYSNESYRHPDAPALESGLYDKANYGNPEDTFHIDLLVKRP